MITHEKHCRETSHSRQIRVSHQFNLRQQYSEVGYGVFREFHSNVKSLRGLTPSSWPRNVRTECINNLLPKGTFFRVRTHPESTLGSRPMWWLSTPLLTELGISPVPRVPYPKLSVLVMKIFFLPSFCLWVIYYVKDVFKGLLSLTPFP